MTVQELVALLHELPDDAPVVVEDADTNWYLNVMDVEHGPRCVVIRGGYGSNRYDEPDEKEA